MAPTIIHLRSETKPLERRSPLSPEGAKALLDAGYIVRVEECPNRIYKTPEFAAVGAEIVPTGSWVNAPKDNIILGLKEIEADGTPIPHTHVSFMHLFKKQTGYKTELARFSKGGGLLYDLEFLTGPEGRRVAAFGKSAGYAGTALALLSWSHQLLHPGTPLGAAPVTESGADLIKIVRSNVEAALPANNGEYPRVIIIGALGRCGTGAIDCLNAVGIPEDKVLKWDMAETSRGGPFPEIAQSDVLVNSVYLGANKAPPFLTAESLSGPERKLRTIADVSCDPNSENNPIPIYSAYSSFDNPTNPPEVEIAGPEIRIIAIDHLPTLIAREASDEYSAQLLPSLLTLDRRDTEGVWTRAEQIFKEKMAEAGF